MTARDALAARRSGVPIVGIGEIVNARTPVFGDGAAAEEEPS